MGLIPKLASFLGIDKFGKGIASAGRVISGHVSQDTKNQEDLGSYTQKLLYAARNETNPEKRARLLKVAQQNGNYTSGITAGNIDPGLNLSNKEVLGSAANVGLNLVAGGELSGGAKAGGILEKFAPKAAETLNTVVDAARPALEGGGKLGYLGRQAALGAGYGAASGLYKNRSASGIAGSTVGGGVLGFATGTAGLALKVAKDFITQTTPEWLMNKAVKPALDELKKNVKYGSDTLGKQLLDEGVKGGPRKLLQIADTQQTRLESDLDKTLTQSHLEGKVINRENLRPYFDKLIEQKNNAGLAGDVQRITGMYDALPERLTLPEAQARKVAIYQELRDPAYKLDAKLSTKAAGLKAVAAGLKDQIEKTVQGTSAENVVRDINTKLSIYGRLENRVTDQLARSMKNNAFTLTDGLLLTAGAAGSAVDPNEQSKPTGYLLAMLGILARHNPELLNTYTAQFLNHFQDAGNGLAGQATSAITKRLIFNLGNKGGTSPTANAPAATSATPAASLVSPQFRNQSTRSGDNTGLAGALNEQAKYLPKKIKALTVEHTQSEMRKLLNAKYNTRKSSKYKAPNIEIDDLPKYHVSQA